MRPEKSMRKPRLIYYNDGRHELMARERHNALEVTLKRHFKALTANRVLHQVELLISYHEAFVPVS